MTSLGSMKPYILVVDTDLQLASMIMERLADHGFDADHLSDPSLILSSLEKTPYHLVILNGELGNLHNGLDICREIKDRFPSNPEIVLLRDEKSKTDLPVYHEAGCGHVLNQPLNFNELCDVIERSAGIEGKRRFDGTQMRLFSIMKSAQVRGIRDSAKEPEEIKVHISNIGRGGFYYEVNLAPHAPQVGQILQFELILGMVPDYKFSGKGIVTWVQRRLDHVGVGIEFVSIPEETESLIQSFVDLFKVRAFIPTQRLDEAAAAASLSDLYKKAA